MAYFREKLAQYTNTDPRLAEGELSSIIDRVYSFWRTQPAGYRFSKKDIPAILRSLGKETAKKRENAVQILVSCGLLSEQKVLVIDKDVRAEMSERYTVFVNNYLNIFSSTLDRSNLKRGGRKHVPSVPFCILQIAHQVSDELYEKIRVWTTPVRTQKTHDRYNWIFRLVIEFILEQPQVRGRYIKREESKIGNTQNVDYSTKQYAWKPARQIQYEEISQHFL